MKIYNRHGSLLVEVPGDSLGRARLNGAGLRSASLHGKDLRGADLSYSDLFDADLYGADLEGADLSHSNLFEADLCGANLEGADLSGAIMNRADVSGAKGIDGAAETLRKNFIYIRGALQCYKAIGKTIYSSPKYWDIRPGSSICEVVNWDRTDECGCGVNFGTLKYVLETFDDQPIWLCRVETEYLAGITVPLEFEGAARCERLTLVRELSKRSIWCRLAAEQKKIEGYKR